MVKSVSACVGFIAGLCIGVLFIVALYFMVVDEIAKKLGEHELATEHLLLYTITALIIWAVRCGVVEYRIGDDAEYESYALRQQLDDLNDRLRKLETKERES